MNGSRVSESPFISFTHFVSGRTCSLAILTTQDSVLSVDCHSLGRKALGRHPAEIVALGVPSQVEVGPETARKTAILLV